MSNGKGSRKFYGKYQGTVLSNLDPLKLGRLLVEVPDVVGLVPSSWAVPCVPLAGPAGPMGVYIVPPVGAGVWIEFENGDPERPVWVGCRWGTTADIPLAVWTGNPVDPPIVIQSFLQQAIIVSDMPPAPPPPIMPPIPTTGGIILRSITGAYIVVNDSGIYISNGKGATITMIGPTITINNGALVVA